MSTRVELGSMLDSDPKHRGGRPFVAGTRLSVDRIAVMHGWGWSPQRMAYEHDHSLAQIYAGLAFYLFHKQEVDDDIRRSDEAYDRLADAHHRGVEAGTSEWKALGNRGPFATPSDFGGLIESSETIGSRLAGTEVTVSTVGALRDSGRSIEEIASHKGVSVAQVFAALAVYEANRPAVAQSLHEEPVEYDSL